MRGLKALSLVLAAAALLALPAVCHAEVVAGWNFAPSTPGNPATFTPGLLSAQAANAGTDANVTLSNLSAGAPAGATYGAVYDNGGGKYFNVMESYSSNYAGSPLVNSFTITVNPGYVLNLTSLNAAVGDGTTVSNTGTSTIFSSLTGATVLGSGLDEGIDSTFQQTYGPYATYAATASADLTGSAFQGLTSADGPITFGVNISGYRDGAGVQTLFLNGTVSPAAIPEPATLSLLLLGGIPMLMRRRRAKVAA